MIDHLLVLLLDRWVIGGVFLAALASLGLWVRVKPSGHAVVLFGTVLWTAIMVATLLSGRNLQEGLKNVLFFPAFLIAPLVLCATGRWFAIVLGIACLIIGAVAFLLFPWFALPPVIWIALSLLCALLAYQAIRLLTGPRWTAVVLSLFVILPFWLLPNDNWVRLAASAKIVELCAAEGGQRVFSVAHDVEGMVITPSVLPGDFLKERRLKYVEWPDREGLLRRDDKHQVSRVAAFSAPYELKSRSEPRPLSIVMTEFAVVSRASGQVLGWHRWFSYDAVLHSREKQPPIDKLTWALKWNTPGCDGDFPTIEARTINPRPGPRSYLELAERREIWDWLDPEPQAGSGSKPRYVLAVMGPEEKKRIPVWAEGGIWQHGARARILVRPELRRLGWCPNSFRILEKSVLPRPDGGQELTLKCL